MTKYIIHHSKGRFDVIFSNTESGLLIRIMNSGKVNSEVEFNPATSENVMYDWCREWASYNINGEFIVEEDHLESQMLC